MLQRSEDVLELESRGYGWVETQAQAPSRCNGVSLMQKKEGSSMPNAASHAGS